MPPNDLNLSLSPQKISFLNISLNTLCSDDQEFVVVFPEAFFKNAPATFFKEFNEEQQANSDIPVDL